MLPDNNDPIIVKRLLKVLEYILDSLSPNYGEVPYRRDYKNKENIFINSNDTYYTIQQWKNKKYATRYCFKRYVRFNYKRIKNIY